MRAVQETWWRFGALPAVAVLLSLFAVASLAGLMLDEPTTTAVCIGAVAALALYCFARPGGGWAVFSSAAAPGAASTLLHDIVGTPRWVGAFLIPIAVYLAWQEDREGLPAH
jgi:hypothetical protein